MKYLATIALVILLLSFPLHAQIDSSKFLTTEFALTGGTSYPYLPKDFSDYWAKGWNAGVQAGITFKPGPFGYGSVLLTADVNRFTFDNVKYRNTLYQSMINTTKNPSWMSDVLVNVRGTITSWSDRIQPFFILGIGYMNISAGDITVGGDTSYTLGGQTKNTFAWTGGVGIDFPINDAFGIFVEGRSVLGVTDPTRQYFPFSGGLRYRIQR